MGHRALSRVTDDTYSGEHERLAKTVVLITDHKISNTILSNESVNWCVREICEQGMTSVLQRKKRAWERSNAKQA